MKKQTHIFTRLCTPLLGCLALSVAACAPITAVTTPAATPAADAAPAQPTLVETPVDDSAIGPAEEEVGMAVRQALMTQAQIDFDQIEVIAVEPMEWPDSCLGLAGPDEMCAQVITPGYQVTLAVEGQTYLFRTNQDATVIRPDVTEAAIYRVIIDLARST